MEKEINSPKGNLIDLLYLEVEDDIKHAIEREKQLKNWHREWKWNLVLKKNPELKDLAADWYDDIPGSQIKNRRSSRNLLPMQQMFGICVVQ